MVAAIRYTDYDSRLDGCVTTINELVRELMRDYPPVKDSLSMRPWTCKHGLVHESWYYKEVVCQLMHDDLPILTPGMSFTFA